MNNRHMTTLSRQRSYPRARQCLCGPPPLDQQRVTEPGRAARGADVTGYPDGAGWCALSLNVADDPETIGESRQYPRDFSRVVDNEQTVEGIVSAMLDLHPDRDNPRVLWHSAREAVEKCQQA